MWYNEPAEQWVSGWMPAGLTSRPLSEHTPLVESEGDLSESKKAATDDTEQGGEVVKEKEEAPGERRALTYIFV